ncbi:MAG: threonine aldolase family protein [Candidatus Kapaibacteriota bacterium]
MIDLRSDTVTVPSKEMLEYMIQANVGDDVYGEDLTVNELQEEVAQLFGKEAALFVPSGTMSNQICLALNTQPGEEVIADGDAHIFYYENGAPSRLSNIQIFPIKSEMGEIPIELIEQAIRPDVYYFPRTALIALENTHNRHGGTILSLEYIKMVSELAKKYGIKMHLDGARIWNAHSITQIPLEEYGKYFDTISVCFSKGLGAPIGSMLISTKENIKKALKLRKTFGGGMRQVGIIAAAAKYALMYNLPKLIEDHNKAIEFSKSLQNSELIKIDISKVHTNIVMFDIADGINVVEFVENLKRNGVLLSGIGGQRIRAVFHINISMENALKSSEIIIQTLNGLKK